MKAQFQLGGYIHASTNTTHSQAKLQLKYEKHKTAKVVIKSCRFARK